MSAVPFFTSNQHHPLPAASISSRAPPDSGDPSGRSGKLPPAGVAAAAAADKSGDDVMSEFMDDSDDSASPSQFVASPASSGLAARPSHPPANAFASSSSASSSSAALGAGSLKHAVKPRQSSVSATSDGTTAPLAKKVKAPGLGKKDKQGATGDKKKKAGRACATCQKAHLTCDDARPCARCVKKGCPEQCHDGARKKAKYLQEIPDELLERRPPLNHHASSGDQSHKPDIITPKDYLQLDDQPRDNGPPSNGLDMSTSLDTNPTPSTSTLTNYDPFSFSLADTNPSAPLPTEQQHQQQPVFSFDMDPSSSTNLFGSEAANLEYAILSSMLSGNGFKANNELDFGAGGAAAPGSMGYDLHSTNAHVSTSAGGWGAGPSTAPAPLTSRATPRIANGDDAAAEKVYKAVTKPYPYAQSYHYLVRHLKDRFEKNDILRIIRALATFRPSLIALQMPLSEEDETFVERTFQRTLVELQKLISFSGTPTVVWRRTGEVCVVGTEFCLLTGWKREELVGKKFIFELFDTASVVEYYESFARHAFESTSSSVSSQCVVLGPTGKPIPCAFCFSVRRDLFSVGLIAFILSSGCLYMNS